VKAANEKIAAKDFDGAIAILEDFTARNPQRGGAVQLLARTYVQKGDVDAALRAYERLMPYPASTLTSCAPILASSRCTAMRASGRCSRSRPITRSNTNINFGSHASTAGDLNGDGYADVFIGAPGDANGAGRATVFSGKDGAVLLTLEGEKAGDAFGSTLAGALDGKERVLMVGAPGAGSRGSGRAYVYKGLTAKPAFTLGSDETGGAFGAMFMSIVGDVNADKVQDLYVSDWANNANARGTGRAYVYSGADGKLLSTMTGEAPGDGIGIGVADAGDADRDGAADLIVGAWQNAGAALSGGKVYLYSGRTHKLLQTITCRIAGDTFGFDTTNLGDVDGDGAIDFLITSAWSGVNGFQSGRVFVIAGEGRKR
jgi:hypothetical protein